MFILVQEWPLTEPTHRTIVEHMNTPKQTVQQYTLYRRIKTQKQNDELVTKPQESDYYTSLLEITLNTIRTHGTYLLSS